jgi:hypothetical protein
LTHQEIVQGRHPNATAKQIRPLSQYGRVAPIKGGWTIYPGESAGVQTLGNGTTEEEAWKAAAAGILDPGSGRNRATASRSEGRANRPRV